MKLSVTETVTAWVLSEVGRERIIAVPDELDPPYVGLDAKVTEYVKVPVEVPA